VKKLLAGPTWRWLLLLSPWVVGCHDPDRPTTATEPDFKALYATRCAGCHGADGKLGPAPPLNDPIFLAIVPRAELLRVIREGRTVTADQKSLMPAFVHDRGGPLTEAQVKVVADGIKERWGPGASASRSLPAYVGAAGGGDKDKGARIFARACADCHGAQGQGASDGFLDGGAIKNQAFLELISDQALRRIIITGRPDLGMPTYDGNDGRPDDFRALTSAEIDDLVALLRYWRLKGEAKGE
jgi:mono/diheme cytochrome c family protein